jgi:alanine-glyoxylate transaminase/serine-glyoxylate transaminase/serine-pyruvate transaminase
MNEVGHLDPKFIELMNESQELLRYVWQTDNSFTIPISGTGSAAMEASLANCVEPGDVVLIGVNGYFGERLCDMASRYGADVRRIEKPWGEVFTLDRWFGLKFTNLQFSGSFTEKHLQARFTRCKESGSYAANSIVCCSLIRSRVWAERRSFSTDGTWTSRIVVLRNAQLPPGSPLTFGERAGEARSRKTKVANWYWT